MSPSRIAALADTRRGRGAAVAALLAGAGLLAVSSLIGDSITFDELHHLTSGYSYLQTGDFRLASTSPPLAKMWCAWPLLLTNNQWPAADSPAWQAGDVWAVGRLWLFELNDGERLMTIARCMDVVLLLGVCLSVYFLGARLFGPRAGLIALVLAVFSPSLLAHGRLATTDIPLTLAVTLTLLAFARLLERVTWGRLLQAAGALAALSLTKFSWPLTLPSLVLMSAAAIVRKQPIPCPCFAAARTGAAFSDRMLVKRSQRLAVVAVATLLSGGAVWLGVWTCFGWRYSVFAGDASPDAGMLVNQSVETSQTADKAWELMFTHPEGGPLGGPTAAFVRWARQHRLLPEGYLYGLLFIRRATLGNPAYLMGHYSDGGWTAYFPIAFAIKTPIPIMALAAAGLMALVARKTPIGRDPLLLLGVTAFAIVFWAAAMASRLNIGERHLLPVYPGLFALSGAVVGWLDSRWGRWLVGIALAWLIGANLWIHPHYLAYFNELIGGPRQGHRYLADSNIDWGQDLKRLAKYAGEHPGEAIKLAYFGSADPSKYGFDYEPLLVDSGFGKPPSLTAGAYVISVTSLLGVYYQPVRDEFWRHPANREAYRQMHQLLARPPGKDASPEQRRRHEEAARIAAVLLPARLVNRLSHRPPDDRIGYSLWVFRLSQDEVDELVSP